jgi:hypothetical protein
VKGKAREEERREGLSTDYADFHRLVCYDEISRIAQIRKNE